MYQLYGVSPTSRCQKAARLMLIFRGFNGMPEAPEPKPLLEALTWHDENSRSARAARIDWASSLYQSTGLVAGKIVPLSLMEEARVSFVNGQFMASVLCATSVVEHLLVDELVARGLHNGKPTLGTSIGAARSAQIFPAEMLNRMEELNNLRNPIAHHRDPLDASTLVSRFLSHKVHPNTLMERDSRFALEVMYDLFRSVLKPGV